EPHLALDLAPGDALALGLERVRGRLLQRVVRDLGRRREPYLLLHAHAGRRAVDDLERLVDLVRLQDLLRDRLLRLRDAAVHEPPEGPAPPPHVRRHRRRRGRRGRRGGRLRRRGGRGAGLDLVDRGLVRGRATEGADAGHGRSSDVADAMPGAGWYSAE